MKQIQLSDNRGVALVDDEDYERVSAHRWALEHLGYAQTYINRKAVFMHRFVMGAGKGEIVDHANRNKLDNRRENLRFCTKAQNNINSPVGPRSTTGFKGVYVTDRKARPYRAHIVVNNKQLYLGEYPDLISAARAYDEAAKKYFGEFAWTNFPEAQNG
jgi:hypothetical protein